MKRKEWLTDNQWGAYEHFAAEVIGSPGWHPYPVTGRQPPQPPQPTVSEPAEAPAAVACASAASAAPPASRAGESSAPQPQVKAGPPYRLVIGRPPAVSAPNDEKAGLLAAASAVVPFIEEALERSGKGKTAKARSSELHSAVADNETNPEENEVEQDDEEVEDEDNVELAPPPRKTYARIARRSAAPVSATADRKRHERRCLICRHPEREEIEDEFIQWQHPYDISKAYGLNERVVYRHARAVGLYARRTRNVRSALDSVLQNCYDAKVTGDTIVRAVRAYTRITDDGQWIDPPSRVIFSSASRPASTQPALPAQPAPQYVIDAATLSTPALVAPANSAAPALPALTRATSNASGESAVRKLRRGPRPKRRNSKRSSNRQRGPIRK